MNWLGLEDVINDPKCDGGTRVARQQQADEMERRGFHALPHDCGMDGGWRDSNRTGT